MLLQTPSVLKIVPAGHMIQSLSVLPLQEKQEEWHPIVPTLIFKKVMECS